jgi:hypothetical protein
MNSGRSQPAGISPNESRRVHQRGGRRRRQRGSDPPARDAAGGDHPFREPGGYEGIHHDPLLFIVRSVRFGWGTLKLLLNARSGMQAASEDLNGAFEAFQQLSIQTAQRVVRFTAARERAGQNAGRVNETVIFAAIPRSN